MKKLINEFKEFALKGNMLDMAIGLIMGSTKICPYCKSEIHIDAVKCPHCASDLPLDEKKEAHKK